MKLTRNDLYEIAFVAILLATTFLF